MKTKNNFIISHASIYKKQLKTKKKDKLNNIIYLTKDNF